MHSPPLNPHQTVQARGHAEPINKRVAVVVGAVAKMAGDLAAALGFHTSTNYGIEEPHPQYVSYLRGR